MLILLIIIKSVGSERMSNNYYTIGQLAKICDISIQTLRYYDNINLLKPSKINEENSYRQYSDSDILSLRIILNLKEIGFSLEEINSLINNDNNDFAIEMLENKKNEYYNKLLSVNFTINKINDQINNLRLYESAADTLNEFAMTIELKQLPERTVAFTRYHSNCKHETLAKRFFELDKLVKDNSIVAIDSRIGIYHDFLDDYNKYEYDLELCLPVDKKYRGKEFVHTIDPGLYATGIYKGEYKGQCSHLVSWIKNQGYEIIGPGVEIYINSFMNTKFPKNYVTEVQFPVKKY